MVAKRGAAGNGRALVCWPAGHGNDAVAAIVLADAVDEQLRQVQQQKHIRVIHLEAWRTTPETGGSFSEQSRQARPTVSLTKVGRLDLFLLSKMQPGAPSSAERVEEGGGGFEEGLRNRERP